MTICYTAHGNYSVKSIQYVVSNRWDEISFKQLNVHDKTSISNILTQKGCMLKLKAAQSFLWNVLNFIEIKHYETLYAHRFSLPY